MKLSSMLLPTGEFILIGSSVKRPLPPDTFLDGLKDAIGAAAVLIVEQDVEAEDALFDENARRVEPETPLADAADAFTKTLIPHAVDPSGREFSIEFTATPGDANLFAQYFGGADFSPAGLIKSVGDRSVQEWADAGHVDLGGAQTKVTPERPDPSDVEEVLSEEPRLESQNVTAVNPSHDSVPGQFGRSPYTGPQNHDLGLIVMAPEEPQP